MKINDDNENDHDIGDDVSVGDNDDDVDAMSSRWQHCLASTLYWARSKETCFSSSKVLHGRAL